MNKRLTFTLIFFVIPLTVSFITGCSSKKRGHELSGKQLAATLDYPAGSITIAKKLPEITSSTDLPLYGFIPFQITNENSEKAPKWIEINLKEKTISLNEQRNEIATFTAATLDALTPGTVKVQLTTDSSQPTPLWHASDEYFTERNMEIPPVGDSARFLKGALGEEAIFLSDEITLHSGPEDLPGMTQVRLTADELEILAEAVEHGSKVVIK